jgi:hypothetical protein
MAKAPKNVKVIEAKFTHICEQCGLPIADGDKMMVVSFKEDGGDRVDFLHEGCFDTYKKS